jgi:methyl-accepting chemotaxis protein
MTIKTKIVIGISAVILLLGGYFAYVEHYSRGVVRELKTLQQDELTLLDAAWQIRWLDEALTASAARYVQSKADPAWQKRYDDHVAMLDVAIATATAKANPTDLKHFTEVDESNKILVDLETKIFASTKAGKFDEAVAILQGEYGVQKAIYKKGVDGFFASQKARLDQAMTDRLEQAKNNRIVATGILAGIAVFITIFGLLLMRSIVTRISRLSAVSNRLAKGEIDGLAIDMDGSDEIAILADGMKGVLAAFEVMLSDVESSNIVKAEVSKSDDLSTKKAAG